VLGACGDRQGVGQRLALQSFDRSCAERRNDCRIFTESFIRAAPTNILRNRNAWREGPIYTGGAYFFRRDARRFLYQFRVARAAERDVVGKYRRADYVVVAVDRVDAVASLPFFGSESPPLSTDPNAYLATSSGFRMNF
jgi:hypothetical protein